MGRNGSGKSSLLWAIQGSGPRAGGTIQVDGEDHTGSDSVGARAKVGLVPQTPADLLYLSTVDDELAEADRETDATAGSARELLDRIVAGIDGERHPRDLSEGQRLGLVLAIQLAARPRVVLLDEPTRGLDYRAKGRLADVLTELAAADRAVLLSTHDVEFVAMIADRVVVLGDGEVVADGDTAEVVLTSPAFAPQVAKVLAPAAWLTAAEVADALGTTIDSPAR
jgi:energy-coupling factor transport system ATP-binding protein